MTWPRCLLEVRGGLRALVSEGKGYGNEVGSIVPGKLANFTILEDNPITCDRSKIKDIAVRSTVVGASCL